MRDRPFPLANQLLAAAGALLVVSLFVSWYGIDLGAASVGAEQAEDLADEINADTTASAWEAFELIDLVLVAVGLTALGAGLAPLRRPAAPVEDLATRVVAGLGALATLLIVFRLFNRPGPDDVLSLEAGAFIGLAAAIAIAVTGARARAAPRADG